MVTGYPHVLVGPQTASSVGEPRVVTGTIVTRGLRRVGQLLCGLLSGHDLVRHYEQNRVALVCASCGHVSPGWELTAPMPQQRFAGDPERHQMHVHPTDPAHAMPRATAHLTSHPPVTSPAWKSAPAVTVARTRPRRVA